MPFLIDLTDERFLTPENAGVIAFIRATNPFAHSDVGERLFRLGKDLPDAQAYCPAAASYAYVVLHTQTNRIFAIAYGMRDLAFRLPETLIPEALADGGTRSVSIGDDWVSFHPWPPEIPMVDTDARLRRWCEVAFRSAVG